MKYNKTYEPNDQMVSIIADNYDILQSLGAFGISLGFGNKTVDEVCKEQNVDTLTFLTIVNFTINDSFETESTAELSLPTLLQYLKSCHQYYVDFQLPFIRKELVDALDENDNVAKLILKIYDEYAHSICHHMKYEEDTVFPYVEGILQGSLANDYNIDTYLRNHKETNKKLWELKNIIIKYLPSDGMHNNLLTAALHDIYNQEHWLTLHAKVEDYIFIPTVRLNESRLRQNNVTVKITKMLNQSNSDNEELSDREKDVVIALVQGMSNKEIADHLNIATNTVITHRRNIAKKLQIHSPAGLTIYAIVNNLIDISTIKL